MARMNEEMRESEGVFGAAGQYTLSFSHGCDVRQQLTDHKPAATPQETMRRFRTSSGTSVTWRHMTRRGSADGSSAVEEPKKRRRWREEER